MSIREDLGEWLGRVWSRPVAAISHARHARMFHPRGLAFTAVVEPLDDSLGLRVAGPALVRLSGALFKREVERLEVLGFAMRVSDRPVEGPTPSRGDQDLLFATIVSPLTLPFSPFTTRSDDFLANRYWAVAPFDVERSGRIKLRLTPVSTRHENEGLDRNEKILRAVSEERASLRLEARRTLTFDWSPIANITLERPSDIDQEALRFDPFRNGRGIVPAGFVHAIRRKVYASSQAARPAFTL